MGARRGCQGIREFLVTLGVQGLGFLVPLPPPCSCPRRRPPRVKKELLGKNKDLRSKAEEEARSIRAELAATRQSASMERQRLNEELRAVGARSGSLQAEPPHQERIRGSCSPDAGRSLGGFMPATLETASVSVAEASEPTKPAAVDTNGGILGVANHPLQTAKPGRAASGVVPNAGGKSEPGGVAGSPVEGRTGWGHLRAEQGRGMGTGSGDRGDGSPSSLGGIREGIGVLEPGVRRNLRGVFLKAQREQEGAWEKVVGATRSRGDEAAGASAGERELEGELETAQVTVTHASG